MKEPKVFLFYFYVPVDQKEVVKNAVFKAFAGEYEKYDCCSFEYSGMGQFRAKDGANPFVGEVGKLEVVQEVKVEMIVKAQHVWACKEALKQSHPYEEVAFGFLPIYHIE